MADTLPEEIVETMKRLDELAKKLTALGVPTTVSASIELHLKSGNIKVEMSAQPKEKKSIERLSPFPDSKEPEIQ